MVNAGVHPLVPETASVGAGDIGQMAGMAQVAIGVGRAEYRGDALPGGEALARAGIAPLELEAKDGLALISANGVSIGHGALVVDQATRVADAADVTAALSMEATGSNLSIIEPAVAEAKPFPGQIAAASHLREVLAGSYLSGRTQRVPCRTRCRFASSRKCTGRCESSSRSAKERSRSS